LIEAILPAGVVAAAVTGDIPDARLFPEESAAILGAVRKRRLEFTTGRACARAALTMLGLPPAPIVPAARGAPRWPDGVVGSITHCAGYRAAAAARATDVAALGIDAEPHEPLPDGVLDVVALPGEHADVLRIGGLVPRLCWDRVLFSAKESVYKAWFPLTGRWLGFEDARLWIDPAERTFIAEILVPGPTVAGRVLTSFAGRLLVRDGIIVTAVVHPTVRSL
jgi:4'-phosphopantetheinyl transferase EntD